MTIYRVEINLKFISVFSSARGREITLGLERERVAIAVASNDGLDLDFESLNFDFRIFSRSFFCIFVIVVAFSSLCSIGSSTLGAFDLTLTPDGKK